MTSYSASFTQSYKCGFIHSAFVGGHEIIQVQVDPYAYPIEVKSRQAAKYAITKHFKSGRALMKRGAK